MTTNKTQAAKLLTAAEMDLFAASLPAAMKELSPARLAGKVKRARTMRDKFRDLLQRQAVATRGRTGTKAGLSGSANERTAKKAEIFDEVLGRLSAQLEKVQAAQTRQQARDTAAAAKAAQAQARAAARASAPAKTAAKTAAKAPAKKATKKATKTSAPRRPTAPVTQTVKAAVKKAVAARQAAPATSAATSKAKAPSSPMDSPAAGNAALGKGSTRARAAAKSTRLAAAGTQSVQAHISSAGRRAQAKRDKR